MGYLNNGTFSSYKAGFLSGYLNGLIDGVSDTPVTPPQGGEGLVTEPVGGFVEFLTTEEGEILTTE